MIIIRTYENGWIVLEKVKRDELADTRRIGGKAWGNKASYLKMGE